MHELKWSPTEKAVARQAFDKALTQELDDVIKEAKKMVAAVEEISELWDLEGWLARRRRDLERKYDYRYSQLPRVFAILLREGRINEHDLRGLAQEKLERIRSFSRRHE